MIENNEFKKVLLQRSKAIIFYNLIAILLIISMIIAIGTRMKSHFFPLVCFGLILSIYPVINLLEIFADLAFGKVKIISGTLLNKSKQARGNGRSSFISIYELVLVEEDKMTKLDIFMPEYEYDLLEVSNEYKVYVSHYSKVYIKTVRCVLVE